MSIIYKYYIIFVIFHINYLIKLLKISIDLQIKTFYTTFIVLNKEEKRKYYVSKRKYEKVKVSFQIYFEKEKEDESTCYQGTCF